MSTRDHQSGKGANRLRSILLPIPVPADKDEKEKCRRKKTHLLRTLRLKVQRIVDKTKIDIHRQYLPVHVESKMREEENPLAEVMRPALISYLLPRPKSYTAANFGSGLYAAQAVKK